jgi:hypothetical protein
LTRVITPREANYFGKKKKKLFSYRVYH